MNSLWLEGLAACPKELSCHLPCSMTGWMTQSRWEQVNWHFSFLQQHAFLRDSPVAFPLTISLDVPFPALQSSPPPCSARLAVLHLQQQAHTTSVCPLVLWAGAAVKDVQSFIIKEETREQYAKNKKNNSRELLPLANHPSKIQQSRNSSQVPLAISKYDYLWETPLPEIAYNIFFFPKIPEKAIMWLY